MTPQDQQQTSSLERRIKVLVLNPYLPAYRVPFFSQLDVALSSKSLDLQLLTGKPTTEFRQRDDFAVLPFHRERRSLSTNVLGFKLRYLLVNKDIKQADLVVYEYSITNFNTWLALLLPRKHKALIWGHGPGYLSKENSLRLWLQRAMASKADLVLTYTEPGRAKVVALGIEKNNVITMNNTIETDELADAIKSLQPSEIENFKKTHSIDSNDKVFSFIGAIDRTKRIDFLVEVLNRIWKLDKSFKLIVGGAGSERYRLNLSIERGQTIYLGRVGAKEKALMGKISKGIVNPGNTGLLAVDALVMKLPIFGTDALSSPEKDYLTEGASFFTLPNNTQIFAQELLSLVGSDSLNRVTGEIPKLESLVQNFATAIESQVSVRKAWSLLIVTNLPAPYRISLFEELAEYFEVTVAYTGWRSEGRMWGGVSSKITKFTAIAGGKLFGIGNVKIPFANKSLKKLVRGSDIVMTGGWNSPAYATTLRLARKNKTNSILWFESTLDSARFLSGPVARLRTAIFKLADVIYVPGESAAIAAKQYSKNTVPIVVLSNPIQPMFLDAQVGVGTRPKTAGTRYLYFGRLLELKRIDLLIEAFCMSAKPDDTLTIVGDGPMKKSLEQIAKESEFGNQISFERAVIDSDAITVYRQYDVLVLPSNREVWGMVIAEALVLGLRVVASDMVGASATFSRFPTFSSFESGSAIELASKLTQAKESRHLSADERRELADLNSPQVFAGKMLVAVRELNKSSKLGN